MDLDALRLVDLLHFADEIELGLRRPLQREQVSRILRALVECVAGLDDLPIGDQQARAPRQLVLDGISELTVLPNLERVDGDLRAALGLLDVQATADLRKHSGTLRVPCLEDLDDTRQTVRDVRAGDTAGVERAHRQLRARLADRLRGDDADRVADLRHLARRGEDAVADATHAALCAALQHRANRDRELRPQLLLELLEHCDRHDLAALGEHGLARLAGRERLVDVAGEHAAEQRLVQSLGRPDRSADVILGTAVLLADDDVLRHVDQAAGQVARVRRAQCRVGEALARTVRRDEVLEHRQAFHEVGLDRALDDLALRVRHETAHTGQLADLLHRSTRAGVGHHEHRVQLVEVLFHRSSRHGRSPRSRC